MKLLTQFTQVEKQSWLLDPQRLVSENALLFIVPGILNPGYAAEPVERVLK